MVPLWLRSRHWSARRLHEGTSVQEGTPGVEVCATIPSLIIPAVVAGGAAFVASALVWMLFRWHDKDIQPLPDEAGFVDSLKKQSIAPGTPPTAFCR